MFTSDGFDWAGNRTIF